MIQTTAWAQIREVKGTVTDSAGAPLPSASVNVKDSKTGTVTGKDGSFFLNVPQTATTLVISSIGYETREVPVSDGPVNVSLNPASTDLAVVTVVSVGYGTLDKKEVTSAITHLSGKDLNVFGGNAVLNSMQGKVAGLNVVNTAPSDPNASPSIQLRGVSSRNAGLGPLYVINGVPGGNVDNLNQNDIESIDVLKGGAASAIYGTRGSNGVIIITTKKGTSTSYAMYDGYTSFDLPTNQVKVLSPEEFVAHNRGTNYGAKTDWFKSVSRNYAFNQKHTLQFAGGSAKTNYIVSFDYRNATGLDLRSDKQEYGARLNLTHTSANNLYTATVNIAPRYLKSNNASYNAFNQSLTLNPTLPVHDTLNPNRFLFINTGFTGAYNPVEELKTVLSGTEGKYLDWNASFKLNLTQNLYSQITLGQQSNDFFDFGFTPSYNTGAINGNNGRNSANRNYNKNDQYVFEWIGNYKRNIKLHSFNLMGGYSYNYFVSSGMNAGNQNFPSDVLTYNNLGTGQYNIPIPTNPQPGDYTFRTVGSYKNDSKLIAFFGRLNYDLAKKYFLSASLRYEGSSKFGYDNKWGYFPAVSLGWNITKEDFFPKVDWLNDLKLRADYGETGNQDFGNYLSLDTYSGYGYFTFNGASYQVWGPSQNTNYNLQWEKAQNFNLGIDFDLLNRRLTGSINYYIRTNKDLLGYYNVPVPPFVQTTTFANVGTMKNSGLEIQLNARVAEKQDFTWSASLTGAINNNKFLSFSNDMYRGQNFQYMANMPAPGSPGPSQRLEEGRRIGSFYMYKSAGIDATGRLMVYDKSGNIIPGNTAKEDDKQFVGNGLPLYSASLGNTFTYKKLDFSVFFRGAFKYDIFNTTAFYIGTPVTQGGANVLQSAYGDGKYAALTNPETYSTLSDYFLEKGDYVKLDNVTVGYNFKSPIKQVSSIRLYGVARNLYTFTKFTTGDPESVSVNGLAPGVNTSLSYYPSTTQLLIGLQVKF
ncbi:MAG TPA: SusC/RagA family TonB-linked outer membrane protein [Niabella sp.]|nr:SusC/RagA family TonB-linked outer membrane protein [Niabella sp.]HQW16280.1 SusC/RagA family TonB-linked outer membrane protein [Niabella sp.]HRB36098.1 SusC/RagA family TonB-linked outer membrane protein [Niabella sp.]HRB50027.1 SusC/RagA family TonB-linked outer membrane protein [Niabella sp.]HRC06412.1 SusC/RagA family TonB-linked outer membrane protein [Niabella sp.]